MRIPSIPRNLERLVVGKAVLAAGVIAAASLTSPTTATADLLEDVKSEGKLTVGTEARFPPFEFVRDGEIVGYSADMMDIIMKDLPGVTLDRLDIPWQGILPGLKAKKFDFVVTSVTVTRKRCDAYELTYPIADATYAFVKRAGDDSIQKPSDVAGKVVGSQAGSAQLQGLERYSEKLEEETGEGVAEIKTYTDFNQAYADLAAGRVDAVNNSLPNLLDLANKKSDVFSVVKPTFGEKRYFAWAGRDNENSERLVAFFNDQLAKLNESGQLAELQKKWFGFEMDVPAQDVCPTTRD